MKYLKEYQNLYRLYGRNINKFRIPFFIFLMLFVLSFATFLVDDFPIEPPLIMLMMIALTVTFGLIWLIFRIRTIKCVKTFPPQQLHIINNEIPSVSVYEKLLVTSQAVVSAGAGLVLIPMANVLWVYTETTIVRLNGVLPIHKYTTLYIAGRDKKKYAFKIKNNRKAFDFLQKELQRYRLDIVFGTEYGMDNIYKNDINRMIAFSQECAEKQQKEAGYSNEGTIHTMNTFYLDSLPEVKNKYKVDLKPGEKVVFTAKPIGFSTESGSMLGFDTSTFTMTNKRIIADNGNGIWTTGIAEDIVDMRKAETGKSLLKEVFILVTLNKELTYGVGIQKLSGYRFYFRKKDMAVFEDIIRHM